MQWVCDICGYVHEEEEPPESCPVCGAPQSKFTEADQGWDDDDVVPPKDKALDDIDDIDDDSVDDGGIVDDDGEDR